MKGLFLFFSNELYRLSTLKLLKYNLITLPGVKFIVFWVMAYRQNKSMRNMSRWDKYVTTQNMQNDAIEFSFLMELTRLQAYIMAEGPKDEAKFYQAKSDLLSNELINSSENKEFKKWVEEITADEKDYSRIEMLRKSILLEKSR